MKRTALVFILALTAATAVAQTTPTPNRPDRGKGYIEVTVEGITALVVGPIATAYALSTGPWESNPLRGVENRFKEVCEKLLGGTWIPGAPDSCPQGNWLRVWGYNRAK